VAVGPRVELAGPLPGDRTRDCHHLGIEIALGAAELWCPNFACSAQCEQRHPGSAWLYHDHPLAPAEGKAAEPDETSLGHCRADHPERLDRDWTIGIDVVRAVEIDRIDVAARYKLLQVNNLCAFDVECLQLLSGEGEKLAAAVFVTFDDLA